MATSELRHIQVDRRNAEPYRVPYWEVLSGRPGPRVLVTAALHGNEIQGTEVIRRFHASAVTELQRGSCLLLPFANVQAIRRHQPHIDFELTRKPNPDMANNVNCTWPGDAAGNDAQRLSRALFTALVGDATHCIDLHCWNVFWGGTVLARDGHDPAIELAQATALRFGKRTEAPPDAERRGRPCLLSAYFNDTGRVAIAVEFAGQYGFWEREIARGVRALTNCFRALGLLAGRPEAQDEGPIWLNDAEQAEVTAPGAGLFVKTRFHTSDRVECGDLLGHVFTDNDLSVIEVRAPVSGYLYQYGAAHKDTSEHSMMWTHPYVVKGEGLAVIAAAGKTAVHRPPNRRNTRNPR